MEVLTGKLKELGRIRLWPSGSSRSSFLLLGHVFPFHYVPVCTYSDGHISCATAALYQVVWRDEKATGQSPYPGGFAINIKASSVLHACFKSCSASLCERQDGKTCLVLRLDHGHQKDDCERLEGWMPQVSAW